VGLDDFNVGLEWDFDVWIISLAIIVISDEMRIRVLSADVRPVPAINKEVCRWGQALLPPPSHPPPPPVAGRFKFNFSIFPLFLFPTKRKIFRWV
jgi:hypothetical protein